MKLETERLFLRLLQTEDIPILARLWSDPDVTHYIGGPHDYDEVYEELCKDDEVKPPPLLDLWVLVEKSTNRIIGHCGIIDKEIDDTTEYDLNYILDKPVWGKGYATEIAVAIRDYSLEYLRLNRVIALIDPENRASINVALKIGMAHEKDVQRPDGITRQVYSTSKSA